MLLVFQVSPPLWIKLNKVIKLTDYTISGNEKIIQILCQVFRDYTPSQTHMSNPVESNCFYSVRLYRWDCTGEIVHVEVLESLNCVKISVFWFFCVGFACI